MGVGWVPGGGWVGAGWGLGGGRVGAGWGLGGGLGGPGGGRVGAGWGPGGGLVGGLGGRVGAFTQCVWVHNDIHFLNKSFWSLYRGSSKLTLFSFQNSGVFNVHCANFQCF